MHPKGVARTFAKRETLLARLTWPDYLRRGGQVLPPQRDNEGSYKAIVIVKREICGRNQKRLKFVNPIISSFTLIV